MSGKFIIKGADDVRFFPKGDRDPVGEIELSEPGDLVFGRRSEVCDVTIVGDDTISRRHFTVSIGSWGVSVADDGSTHGTFVNGERLSEKRDLKPGDEIRLGKVAWTIAFADDADGAGAEASVVESRLKAKFKPFEYLCKDEMLKLKKRIQDEILLRLNAGARAKDLSSDKDLAERAKQLLDQVLREFTLDLPSAEELKKNGLRRDAERDDLREALVDDLLRWGPISPFIDDPEITEIMVNGPYCIFVEIDGIMHGLEDVRFRDEQHLMQVILRIVQPLGRQINATSPMVDARLPDGSRVNAIIPPLAIDGPALTIRKFSKRWLTVEDLKNKGSMSPEMAKFLELAVRFRQSILVSGGTGSGKTTLLNVLSQFIPNDKRNGERIVTIEDSAELNLSHKNIVRLEARPANIQGAGKVTIRDLVVNSLRMRPDRIIVGECRGAEALDMLQAMNTGHNGSLTTCHANSPRDALARLENMVMMAGYELPSSAIREQIASAIKLIVQEARMSDGTRKIVKICEVTGRDGDVIQMQDIFEFVQTGIGVDGKVEGYYTATGDRPYFIDALKDSGVPLYDAAGKQMNVDDLFLVKGPTK